eukprot:g5250.t1
MSVDTPTLILSVLEHLAASEAVLPSAESRSSVASAISSLSSAFDVSLDNAKQVRELSLKPHTLELVFRAGCASLGAKSAAQQLAELQSSEAFSQFVKVVSAKGYFKGVEEGSEGYDERMSKLVAKFKARTEAASGGPAVEEAGSSSSSSARSAASAPVSTAPAARSAAAPSSGAKAADEKKAEEVKGEGNKLLLAKDYEGAERCYSEALELSPDGPNSHVYLCNRAAALCYLGRNDDAVVDCQEAIDLNPSYAKAYTRLGYAYFQLEDYEASVKAYKKSLEIEPGNAANAKSLRRAISKLGAAGGSADEISTRGAGGAGGSGGGMPDLSGLAAMMGGAGAGGGAGGAGGGLASMLQGLAGAGGGAEGGGGGGAGGLAGMLNNPNMMAQAQQMMQNPAMMAQVQNMMSNPAMMQGLMGMMGGGAGGGGGGGPDLSALAGMMGGGGGAPGSGGTGGTGNADDDHTS